MSPRPGKHRSVPDRLLEQTVESLKRWESGTPLQELAAGAGEEAAMLRNTLLTMFRHRAVLEYAMGRLATRKVRARLRPVLEWGLCQLFYMRGVPAAVVTDTCVRYVTRRFGRGESGFVNALLRTVVRSGPAEVLEDLFRTAPEDVRLELSPALYRCWRRRFSQEQLESLAARLQEQAPLIVRSRRQGPDAGFLAPLPALPWTAGQRLFICSDASALFASEAFRAGTYYVQDPSTLLGPSMLAVQPGERVADLCAAPGGKAVLLAEALQGAGSLLACDRSFRRLKRVRENLETMAVAHWAVADAARPPLGARSLDAVILDVPCSNTGVIRRRPDVRWRFDEQSVSRLTAIQADILAGAAALVRPGGRLVYSTCSIEPEENSGQVKAFLAAHSEFGLEAEQELLPCQWHDGGYAALLRRGDGDGGGDL